MLYATGTNTRRLLRANDLVDPQRSGKIWPDPESVPEKYRELIAWAKRRYQKDSPPRERWLESLFQLRGLGRDLWNGEDPDEYVRQLREGWE